MSRDSPLPVTGTRCDFVASSPIANRHGIEVWTFVQSSLDEFLSSSSAATTSSDSEVTRAAGWLSWQPDGSIGGSWPTAFFGYPRGAYGDNRGLVPKHAGQTRYRILTLNRGASDIRANAARSITLRTHPGSQAACVFSFVGSKFAPLFQRIKTIAASLRAKVRRAISGLVPFASSSR